MARTISDRTRDVTFLEAFRASMAAARRMKLMNMVGSLSRKGPTLGVWSAPVNHRISAMTDIVSTEMLIESVIFSSRDSGLNKAAEPISITFLIYKHDIINIFSKKSLNGISGGTDRIITILRPAGRRFGVSRPASTGFLCNSKVTVT